MVVVALINMGTLSDKEYQARLQTGNYTVNENPGGVETSPINIGFLTLVIVTLSAFIALAVVISTKVFGSGVGEFGVKTFVIGGIAIALWGFLSALTLSAFTSMPIFGIPFYLVLSICYALGVIGVLGGSGV